MMSSSATWGDISTPTWRHATRMTIRFIDCTSALMPLALAVPAALAVTAVADAYMRQRRAFRTDISQAVKWYTE